VAYDGSVDTAMKIICEAFSDQSKGEGFAMTTEEFIDMFKEVAAVKELEDTKVQEIIDYLESAGAKQNGILSFENFKTDMCPALQ
jgi:hypothetical protein